MRWPNGKRLLLSLALSAGSIAFGQVAQDFPELCGRPGASIPVPPGVTIASDPSNSRSELRIRILDKAIVFPAVMETVQQACPIAGHELVVFGLATPALYNIEIVRLTDGSLRDSFYGFSPIIAPNQRWLVRRKFYPAQAVTSEEYVIYDLAQDWAHNREPGIARSDMDLVGKLIYPVVAGNWPFYSDHPPPSETHSFRSDSFYWAPDSGAVLFADSVEEHLSLVLVSLENDNFRAYLYRLTDSEACPGSAVTWPPTLSSAEVSLPINGRRGVHAAFRVGNSPCRETLTLQSDDFKAATPEVHVMPSTPIGR
ncbi:MAG TPA: hypothetical protein VMF91_08500 [Bryobacteraceae bacterium]|nr:hypothetical protein [Bryobacteraceae bacterium]